MTRERQKLIKKSAGNLICLNLFYSVSDRNETFDFNFLKALLSSLKKYEIRLGEFLGRKITRKLVDYRIHFVY